MTGILNTLKTEILMKKKIEATKRKDTLLNRKLIYFVWQLQTVFKVYFQLNI